MRITHSALGHPLLLFKKMIKQNKFLFDQDKFYYNDYRKY